MYMTRSMQLRKNSKRSVKEKKNQRRPHQQAPNPWLHSLCSLLAGLTVDDS